MLNHLSDIEIVEEVTPQLSEEELENLGPGCYVQVKDGDNCFWAEITADNGERFSGRVHCELGASVCHADIQDDTIAEFTRQQIVNLGCDNYCFC